MNGAVPFALGVPPDDALPDSDALLDDEDDDQADGPVRPLLLALLFAPYIVAFVLAQAPLLSYCIAWAGSLWILWLSIGGHVRQLPDGASALDQVTRPIVLTQILFASYNFLTSVFYVADLYGYYYLQHVSLAPVDMGAVAVAAEAQRYYVLAHAAIVMGMLLLMRYPNSGEWAIRPLKNPARAALILSGVCLMLGKALGAQNQFGIRIGQIGLVASVLALALAFPTRQVGTLLLGLALYGVNLGAAFLSGWKEEVLVMVILLAVFMYPYARKTVLLGAPIAMIFLLAVLPTYAAIFRGLSWSGEASADDAAAVAVSEIQSGQTDIASTNWDFLTGRISEIGLFTGYIDSFKGVNGSYGNAFYGTKIVGQSAMSLIPRMFWPSKPITETIVMERVYEAGIVARASNVSAKPQYVVDGYLSGGAWGVLLSGLAFGLLASLASRASERWFGGYFWGSGLVYTAMFTALWRGNTFEFFFNTVFWSFVLLIPLFYIGRWSGLIVHASELEPDASLHEEAVDEEPDAELDEDAGGRYSRRRGLWPAAG